MRDLDPAVAELLTSLVPPYHGREEWEAVLASAGIAPAAAGRRRRRRSGIRLLIVAAVVVGTVAAVLLAPSRGAGDTVVERALGAIGGAPVLHAVVEREQDNGTLVHLEGGAEREWRTVMRTEVWYDGARKLQRTVTSRAGVVVDEELQSPAGWFSREGRVFTCAWIAGHPVEATRHRVSCNLSGENGTTPRPIPEDPPTPDPALTTFLSGYRTALADGSVRETGRGSVDGVAVLWLELRLPGGTIEQVALDADTYRPVLVEQPRDRYRVREIESVAAAAADFSRPKVLPVRERPAVGEVAAEREITPRAASTALGRTAAWAGRALNGLPLTHLRLQTLTTGYGIDSGVAPIRSTGLELLYGEPVAGTGDGVVIHEAPRPEFAYGLGDRFRPLPPEGWLALNAIPEVEPAGGGEPSTSGSMIWNGMLRKAGLYITLTASTRELLLAAARALHPIAQT